MYGIITVRPFLSCSHDAATVGRADEREEGKEQGREVGSEDDKEEEPLPEGEHPDQQDSQTVEDRYFIFNI